MNIDFKNIGKAMGGGALGGAIIYGGSKLLEKAKDLPAKIRLNKSLKELKAKTEETDSEEVESET